ncbi:PKD domain-containing protein [Thermogemmatispora carboxidivorans]|uniref:PKD domain-containing protein n=1 Tax=Thermogemmatispora carboxidivorans TaxID=1382306 RepID=UPI0006996479|nr:PKD domain-containing protein [Thermogemmatispora carboxidivorans]
MTRGKARAGVTAVLKGTSRPPPSPSQPGPPFLRPGSRSPVIDFSYRWDFGDGQSALGQRVSHVHRRVGEYQPRPTATASTGAQRLISRNLGIALPKPNNRLSDGVTTVAQATAFTEAPSAITIHPVALVFGVAISLALLFVILIGVLLFISRRQRNDRQNASAHATREHGPGGSS